MSGANITDLSYEIASTNPVSTKARKNQDIA